MTSRRLALGSAALLVASFVPFPTRPATITTSLPPGTVVHRGQTLEFTVQVTSPMAGVVRLVLLDPPPGCVFTQDATSPPTATTPGSNLVTAIGSVRWLVQGSSIGLRRLTFLAADVTHPGQRAVASVDVRVDPEARWNVNAPNFVGDVSGDGVLDVVVGATYADRGAAIDAGAIYVWRGKAAPTGLPDATLVLTSPKTSDTLGYASFQGIQLADVTGDGVLDVVAGASFTDSGTTTNTGSIAVWQGGPALLGTPAPVATLAAPGAATNDLLAYTALVLADVTGDRVPDVVAGSVYADVAGQSNAGAIYVWKGGPTLSGAPAPLATLTAPGATPDEFLGNGTDLEIADVNNDGWLDVIADSIHADVAGVVNAGAIFVWKGGPALNGSPAPLATLTVTGAVPYDSLGFTRIADVTGDGILDVVGLATAANVAGVAGVGAIYVWKGGATLTGSPAPIATLTVPGAVAFDYLGSLGDNFGNYYGEALKLADVTGDGLLDVVAATNRADVAGTVDAGAIYVWMGGATLVGALAPFATLTVPLAANDDQLGRAGGEGLQLADVTGDGVLDLVAGASFADVGGVVNAGAVYVWAGGATLAGTVAPSATLTVPGAIAFDRLGWAVDPALAIQLADVTGDQILDVVAEAVFADVGGKSDAGAVYVWQGGATLAGTVAPLATLAIASPLNNDQLGNASNQGVQLADVTGDGVPDLVVGAMLANVAGKADVGAIYVWEGGATLVGTPAERANLTVPGAVANDQIGNATGQAIQLADVTGDGWLDVVAGAALANVAGKNNVGAIYVWNGGAALAGSLGPSATLAAPSAAAGDQLGDVSGGQGIRLADVTGDGVLDVVGGTIHANVAGVVDCGALDLWTGGATLTGSPPPLAQLHVPGAKASDQLGL